MSIVANVDNQFELRKSILFSLIHWEHLIKLARRYKRGRIGIRFVARRTMGSMARSHNDSPSYGGCALCVHCDRVCSRCPLPATKAGMCVGGTVEERYNSAYYRAAQANNWDDFITWGKIVAESLRGLWKSFDKQYV